MAGKVEKGLASILVMSTSEVGAPCFLAGLGGGIDDR